MEMETASRAAAYPSFGIALILFFHFSKPFACERSVNKKKDDNEDVESGTRLEGKLEKLSNEIPYYFQDELDTEWKRKKDKYQELEKLFDKTPFSGGIKKHIQKIQYYKEILSHYSLPTWQGEEIKLSDLYLEPNFFFHEHNVDKSKINNLSDGYEKESNGFLKTGFNGSIYHFLYYFFQKRIEWFLNENQSSEEIESRNEEIVDDFLDPECKILFLIAQPGQGKTAFCYKLINYLISENRGNHLEQDVVFIKIKNFRSPKKLLDSPVEELNNYLGNKGILIDEYSELILIIDGLDEFIIREPRVKNKIRGFIETLIDFFEGKNNSFCLITSRAFGFDPNYIFPEQGVILSIAPFSPSQQEALLNKYPNSKISLEVLNKLNSENIKESPATVPLILSLIAKFGVKKEDVLDNKAQIYTDIFQGIISRDFKNRRNIYRLLPTKRETEAVNFFKEYFCEIALKIYHSNRNYLTYDELIKMPRTEEILKEIDSASISPESSLEDILTTFYFEKIPVERNTSLKNNFAIGFIHKSFQDFFVGIKIYEDIINIVDIDKSTVPEGKSKEILEKIWDLLSPTPITLDIIKIIGEKIKNDSESLKDKGIAKKMKSFYPFFLKTQFISQENAILEPYLAARFHNCFFVYTYFLSKISKIGPQNYSWLGKESVLNFLTLLKFNYYFEDLKFDLSNQDLATENEEEYSCINISGSELQSCQLNGVKWQNFDLSGAKFDDSKMEKADFTGSNLSGATFSRAKMKNVVFVFTNCYEAIFEKSQMHEANLYYSNFEKAKFNEAELNDANLTISNFSNTEFKKAKLTEVDFTGANLLKADFTESVLKNADLSRTNLSDVNFTDADLSGTNFENAQFYTTEQLSTAKSLRNIRGLDSNIEKMLREKLPELFS